MPPKKTGLASKTKKPIKKTRATHVAAAAAGPSSLGPAEICFGLNRQTDERSLAAFVERFADPAFLTLLIPRLSDSEITAVLDFLTELMHKHVSEGEYHRLFLKD